MAERVEYRPIDGCPGYRVGSDGTVQSCWRRVWDTGEKGCRSEMGAEWHDLKPVPNRQGYLVVTLKGHDGRKTGKVHILVATAFLGPRPEPGMHCAHYPDRDKTNNAVSNLVWATPQENTDHKLEQGTQTFGEDAPNVKMTEGLVLQLLDDRRAGATYTELSHQYGISVAQVGNIVSGYSWPHVKRD